jgi:hypothetical protein
MTPPLLNEGELRSQPPTPQPPPTTTPAVDEKEHWSKLGINFKPTTPKPKKPKRPIKLKEFSEKQEQKKSPDTLQELFKITSKSAFPLTPVVTKKKKKPISAEKLLKLAKKELRRMEASDSDD